MEKKRVKTGKYRRAAAIFGLFLLLIGVEFLIIFGLWWHDINESEGRKQEESYWNGVNSNGRDFFWGKSLFLYAKENINIIYEERLKKR